MADQQPAGIKTYFKQHVDTVVGFSVIGAPWGEESSPSDIHLRIGTGDSRFTDPSNPPALLTDQAALVNQVVDKVGYLYEWYSVDETGQSDFAVNGTHYNVATLETASHFGVSFALSRGEQNGVTFREIGFFIGDVAGLIVNIPSFPKAADTEAVLRLMISVAD